MQWTCAGRGSKGCTSIELKPAAIQFRVSNLPEPTWLNFHLFQVAQGAQEQSPCLPHAKVLPVEKGLQHCKGATEREVHTVVYQQAEFRACGDGKLNKIKHTDYQLF